MNYTCNCIKSAYGNNCQYYSNPFTNSTILHVNGMQSLKKLLNIPLNKTWQLLYQASRDGFNSSIFHSNCDGVLGTLTVIKSSNNNIFGGYTEADWSGFYQYQNDANGFLFSLVNSHNNPVKMNVIQSQYAIYSAPSNGPVFGGGHDLYVALDNSYGYSNLGNSYELPSFLAMYGTYSEQTQSFLAGSYRFQAVEVEVYSIQVQIDRNTIFVANYDLLAAFPLILFNSFKSVQVSHVGMVVFAMQLEEILAAHV